MTVWKWRNLYCCSSQKENFQNAQNTEKKKTISCLAVSHLNDFTFKTFHNQIIAQYCSFRRKETRKKKNNKIIQQWIKRRQNAGKMKSINRLFSVYTKYKLKMH